MKKERNNKFGQFLPLLNSAEAAEFLGVSNSVLCKLVRKEQIPSVKISGARRFRVESLAAWAESQEGGQSTEPQGGADD